MKKVYLSILFLLCVATNLYAAAEESSFVVCYDKSDGLPGTLTGDHYVWESELCTAETPINGVRLTFFTTEGGVLFNGYPSVAIGELEFYDADGNKIAYTAENVSTNSLEGLEGAIENLNDGVYTTFYHSAWRTNVIEEELDDYVYLDITFPEAVSQFKIKQVSRSLGYVTYVIPIGIIVTPVGVNYADVELPASGSCGENLTWNFDAESGALSIEGSGEMYYGAISPMLTNVIKTVNLSDGITSIGDYAFSGCSGLTSITIPEGVTSIGENAFYNCAGLTSIVVDNNNSAYDSREGCNAIIHTATNTLIQGCNNTTIPSSVTSIGNNAFCGCSGLTSITIPEGVTSIGNNAFSGCSGLTSITIPEGVTTIRISTFYNCTGLTSITIPSSVKTIAIDVFIGCNALESVYISDYEAWSNIVFANYTTSNPLNYASNLYVNGKPVVEELIIPEGVTSIDNGAYKDCTFLKSVIIPEGVIYIGDSAFYGCSSLTSITIPSSVTSIGRFAFYGCSGLTSITIPEGVTSIGENAFYNCAGLTSIVVDNNNSAYDSREGCNAIIHTATNTLIQGCNNTTIPSSVTSIRHNAFCGCSRLTSITIPEGVTSIEENAFYNCAGLTSIVVDNNNSAYDSREGCNAIIETETNTLIQGCNNTTIPSSVTSIGNNAFFGCSGLTSITISEGVTSIEGHAFYNCTGLTSITIPSSVTSIGCAAFSGCTGLTSITISEGVTSIESHAFYNCTGLTSITIPSSVTSIGDYAFSNCSSLDTVIAFPEIAPTISYGTFAGTSVLYYPVGSDYSSWFSYFSTSKPYENTLKVADVDAVPGEQIKLSVNMSNCSNITAMQFDVLLPSGLTFATDEDGYELIELSSARTNSRKHILTYGYMPDESTMRVIIYSNSNIFFSGNEGEVITMTLNVSPNVADGDYSIIFKDIELVEITNDQSEIPHITEEMVTVVKVERIMGDLTGDKKVSIADVVSLVGVLMGSSTDNLNMDVADMNNDGRISITDVVSVVSKIFDSSTPAAPAAAAAPAVRTGSLSEVSENLMYIEPFTLGAGEEKEILVYLDNPDVDITAFQFDIRLPEGIEIPIDFVDGENTYYQVYLGSRTNSRLHAEPECGELYDGLYRIAVYSSKNSNFKERSGDVVSMFVRGSETLSPGVYELEMSNIEIVEYNEEAIPYILADYTSSIVSGDGASTAPMLKGVFSTESMSELSSAFKDNTDITSLDLRNAVSIDSEGRILTGNPNTLVLLSEGMSLSNEHNVIIGNTCSSFSLTDGYTFASPVDFTAESFVYNRTVDAAKTVSFILPVSIDASNLNGTVYELSDVSGSELNFTEVHGILEANKPYLLLTDAQGTMLGDDITNVTVIATPETEMSVTIGNIRHIGSYAQQSVESSSSVAYYGYSEGAFVKALTGTLNPYRTMIASDNVTAAKVKSYSLLLNGTTTGIEDPAGDEADGLIYDLYGRKLEQITSPGIYIVNGKKVYIK